MICGNWEGGAMDTHRQGPREQIDEKNHRVPGATLGDPNRLHVTLDNLADLAGLDAPALPAGPRWDDDSGDAAPDPVEAPLPDREAWARPAERWLLESLAVGGASVAFVAPSIWLVVVAVATVVGGIVAFVLSGHAATALPGRAVRRSLTLLRPKSSLWAPVLMARTVLAAVVLPGAIAAAGWAVEDGTSGAFAAARAGAWTHAFRVAAALVCFMLLTSVGDGRQRRARSVRRWAMPATDGTLVLLVISCWAAAALVILAVPHPSDAIASRADGLGWLPPAARAQADRVRDDIVTNELNSLASCLSTRTGAGWQPSYTTENAVWTPDVARLVADDRPRDVATVVAAAHNQLAPWVEVIEVELPDGELVRTDRASLPRSRPLTDADLLVAATSTGAEWLRDGVLDEDVALRCSAGPVI